MGELIELKDYKDKIPKCRDCAFRSEWETLGYFYCKCPESSNFDELLANERACEHFKRNCV